MNTEETIKCIYDYIKNDEVERAVTECLKIACSQNDLYNFAYFLRELHPTKNEFLKEIYLYTEHLKKEAQSFLYAKSLERWMDHHKIDNPFDPQNGEEKKSLAISVGEIEQELIQWEQTIKELSVPAGMTPYDTAAFTDRYNTEKAQIRSRMRALRTVKARIKTTCLNYVVRLERQFEGQCHTNSILDQIYTEVNNYFKAHSEDVYMKLDKAGELLHSNNPEDLSLLLTQVRRIIKSVADYFYPSSGTTSVLADGKQIKLGEEQYLNRLREYLFQKMDKSISRELLIAELDYLGAFLKKLNQLASKGVHDNVSMREAKQGVLGLYVFLSNIISSGNVS